VKADRSEISKQSASKIFKMKKRENRHIPTSSSRHCFCGRYAPQAGKWNWLNWRWNRGLSCWILASSTVRIWWVYGWSSNQGPAVVTDLETISNPRYRSTPPQIGSESLYSAHGFQENLRIDLFPFFSRLLDLDPGRWCAKHLICMLVSQYHWFSRTSSSPILQRSILLPKLNYIISQLSALPNLWSAQSHDSGVTTPW
jgi:hypothetical protein